MKALFYIALFANILGAIYGFFFFYPEQLQQQLQDNPLLLVFVPDCPLYSALFAIVMILVTIAVRSELAGLLCFVTMAGMAKYGIWTISMLLFYGAYYLSPPFVAVSTMLIFAHIGMFLQSFTLIGKFKFKNYFVAVTFIWLLLNDISDYALGTHPFLPETNLMGVAIFTFALTVVSVIFAVRLSKSKLKFFRELLFE